MAVLGGTEDVGFEVDGPEIGYVVDHDEVGIEVDYAIDGNGDEVGEVDAGVVQGLVEGAPDGGRDFVFNEVCVEVVEVEGEVREGGQDGAAEISGVTAVSGGGGEEVEDDVFRAGGVLEDGEDSGDGAAEVGGVEGHGYMDYGGVVVVTFFSVSEFRGFLEFRVVSDDGCRNCRR